MSGYNLSVARRGRLKRTMITLTVLAILIAAAFVISVNTGYIKLSPLELIRTLFGGGTAKQQLVLFEFRLPRIFISILIGAGLAVSGCVLQALTRNELAEPGLLGINAGAGLMVVLFVTFFSAEHTASIFLLPFLAFLGAGLTAVLIFTLSYSQSEGFEPMRMVLVGIAVGVGISAVMIVLTIRLDPETYQFVATWLAGSIWGSNWKFVLSLLPWIVILLPYVFYKGRVLDVLNLGDQLATGLGAVIQKQRLALLGAAVALAGACVAVGGGIGFVGLIAPHLARRLIGPQHQALLPASALVGALMVIAADTLARWLIQPSEIPTGIVVAVIGAPYFLYLLAKTKG